MLADAAARLPKGGVFIVIHFERLPQNELPSAARASPEAVRGQSHRLSAWPSSPQLEVKQSRVASAPMSMMTRCGRAHPMRCRDEIP